MRDIGRETHTGREAAAGETEQEKGDSNDVLVYDVPVCCFSDAQQRLMARRPAE